MADFHLIVDQFLLKSFCDSEWVIVRLKNHLVAKKGHLRVLADHLRNLGRRREVIRVATLHEIPPQLRPDEHVYALLVEDVVHVDHVEGQVVAGLEHACVAPEAQVLHLGRLFYLLGPLRP